MVSTRKGRHDDDPMNIQRSIPSPPGEDYETDFHAWLGAQADALRAGDPTRLDWTNLLEEVETLGRSQRLELLNRLTTIIEHLLKYQHGLDRDPAVGWKRTVNTQRTQIRRLLEQSPSLHNLAQDKLEEVYADGRAEALGSFEQYENFRLDHYATTIPANCPYTIYQILDLDWLPEPAGSS